MLNISYLRKVIAPFFGLVLMLVQQFAPVALAVMALMGSHSPVGAQEALLTDLIPQDSRVGLRFSNDSNKFTTTFKQSEAEEFVIVYGDGEKQNAIQATATEPVGGVFVQSVEYAGTCSGEVCTPHKFQSGKVEIPSESFSIDFEKMESGTTRLGDESKAVFYSVKTDEEYSLATDSATVVFSKVAAGDHWVRVEELQLSAEQAKTINAVSNTAYDITTSMPDGSFEFKLTLPTAASKDELVVKYADSVEALSESKTFEEIDSVTDGVAEVKKVDHMTVFVVTTPPALSGAACITAGATSGTDCYDSIQAAVDAAVDGDTIEIQANFDTTTQISITDKSLTINGNGFTINPTFARVDNDNNSVFGIFGETDTVTFNNLIIDGQNSTNLHGFNVYVSNAALNDVTVRNMHRSGVVVNGSQVSVNNIHTEANGWHGINVDLGSGVTRQAVLTLNGSNTHTADSAQIYVDNTAEDVLVTGPSLPDYDSVDNVGKPGDRHYFLAPDSGDTTFTVKKVDSQGNELSGWQMRLHGYEVVDTIDNLNVQNSNGSSSTDLPAGNYRVSVEGLYRYRTGSYGIVDAGYSLRSPGEIDPAYLVSGNWLDYFNYVTDGQSFRGLGLRINDICTGTDDACMSANPLSGLTNWGTFNPAHSYTIEYAHTGGPIKFSVRDNQYPDNSLEDMVIEISQLELVAEEVTDGNGDAVFADVPHGEYMLSEVVPSDWETVELRDQNGDVLCSGESCFSHAIVVDENTTEFTFENTLRTSAVTVCKENLAGARLSGWTVGLAATSGESVQYNVSSSAPVSVALTAGDYLLKASGMYRYGGTQMIADAGYNFRPLGIPFGTDDWVSGLTLPSNGGLIAKVGDRDIDVSNGNGNIQWGPRDEVNHNYSALYAGHAGGELDFWIYDDQYADNAQLNPPLTVETRLVAAQGVTGDNGCVTFDEVPYGEYEAFEIMQDGWEQVSAPGDQGIVTIDSDTEEFVFVNRNTNVTELTVCKEDIQGVPQNGWTMVLYNDEVAMGPLSVDSTQPTAQSFGDLDAGSYMVRSSGTYQYWPAQLPGAGIADAGYSLRPANHPASYHPNDVPTWVSGVSVIPQYALQVWTGAGVPLATNWGAYVDSHEYSALYDHAGGDLALRIYDTHYGDNTGALTLNFHQAMSQQTGDTGAQGCTTFSDLEPGEYRLEEIMQDGWTQVEDPTNGQAFEIQAGQSETMTFVNQNQTPTADEGTLTVCKLDDQDNPLSGWNMVVRSVTPVDTVAVAPRNPDGSANQVVDSSVLPVGDYVLRASGTYTYRPLAPGAEYADAGYSLRWPTDTTYLGAYLPWVDMYEYAYPQVGEPYGHPGYLSVMVNNAKVQWGAYNQDHTYFRSYPGYGGAFTFTIYDDRYDDNSGELTVDIHSGWAQLTEDNGCTTFENVPVGQYTIEEQMQYGWEQLSDETGGNPVTVTAGSQETFTFVNQQVPVATTGEVTVCKENPQGDDLSGWTMMLTSTTPVAGPVNIPSNGQVVETDALAAGEYLARVAGTYTYGFGVGQGAGIADGAFSLRPPGSPYSYHSNPENTWVEHLALPNPYQGYLGAWFNGAALDWGEYQDSHEYSALLTHAGGPVSMRVMDDAYGDNSGSLSANLYVTRSQVTGDNGCTVFTDVNPGEYELSEVLQDGWDQVSHPTADQPIMVTAGSQMGPYTFVNEEEVVPPVTGSLYVKKLVCNDSVFPGAMDLTTIRPTATGEVNGVAWNDIDVQAETLFPGCRIADVPYTFDLYYRTERGDQLYSDVGEFDQGVVVNNLSVTGNYILDSIQSEGRYWVWEVNDDGSTSNEADVLAMACYSTPDNATESLTNAKANAVINLDTGLGYCIVFNTDESLPTGSIQGRKFRDPNVDGTLSDAERNNQANRLDGWTVSLYQVAGDDWNFLSSVVTGHTGSAGQYRFDNLAAGTYTVCESPQAGWAQSYPSTGTENPDTGLMCHEVVLAENQQAQSIWFGNYEQAQIAGTVWNDADAQGDFDEVGAGLGGWTVFLDLNSNEQLDGSEVSTVTLGDGSYLFEGLAAGTHQVCIADQLGWTQTAPVAPDCHAVVINTSAQVVTDQNFGVFQDAADDEGEISGLIWNDENESATQDGSEVGVGGWTVFLDVDADGEFDPGETAQLTQADGTYVFSALPLANYDVCFVLPVNWNISFPATNCYLSINVSDSTPIINRNFGVFQDDDPVDLLGSIGGKVWHDVNQNENREGNESNLSGRTIFIDLDADRSLDGGELTTLSNGNGDYAFSGLALGSYSICQVVPSGWSQTHPSNGNCRPVVLTDGTPSAPFEDFGSHQPSDNSGGGTSGGGGGGGGESGTSGGGTPAASGPTTFAALFGAGGGAGTGGAVLGTETETEGEEAEPEEQPTEETQGEVAGVTDEVCEAKRDYLPWILLIAQFAIILVAEYIFKNNGTYRLGAAVITTAVSIFLFYWLRECDCYSTSSWLGWLCIWYWIVSLVVTLFERLIAYAFIEDESRLEA